MKTRIRDLILIFVKVYTKRHKKGYMGNILCFIT